MSRPRTLDGFLAREDPDSTRVLADITPERDPDGNSPFLIVRYGRYAAVLALMPFAGEDAHLCIDVYPFINGQDATAGVFGMTEGCRWQLPDTSATSHGWPSAHLVSMLIGEQGRTGREDSADLVPPDRAGAYARLARAAGPELIRAARSWIADCPWDSLDEDGIADLSDAQVCAGVARYYDGGWPAFVRDGS